MAAVSTTRPHTSGIRRRERGFSLLEVIVVLVILLVLVALAVLWFSSGRKAGNAARGVAAAEAYASAIEQFSSDNRGVFPRAVGSRDWPTASQGPIHPLARTNGRYLRTIPDSVQAGDVRINAQGTIAKVTYAVDADQDGYELRVHDHLGTPVCSFSVNYPGAAPQCTSG